MNQTYNEVCQASNLRLYICINTRNNQLMSVKGTMRCREFLLLIVDQLSKELLLESILIGNSVHREIRDTRQAP